MARKNNIDPALAEQILAAKLQPGNDAEVGTVREYFIQIAKTVWEEGESFSGKRPFGNSGWEADIAWALVNANIIKGKLDEEEGYLDDYDEKALNTLVAAALEYL